MSLAVYVKKPPPKPLNPNVPRFFYALMSAIGIGSVVFAIYPMVVWQISTLPKLTAKIDRFPIPQSQVLNSQQMLANVQVLQNEDGFSYFEPQEGAEFLSQIPKGERPEEFLITIPKLEVTKAKVAVDSTNFQKHLAHFPGTAIPGEVGNSFITGHSVLPQFVDPKNYLAIFTNLSKLEVGDSIEVEIEGKTLHYIVQYSKVVNPKDTSVLLPISKTGKNLTLMSCVPPGTSLKRLVVITSLI